MGNNISSELIRGHIDTIILNILSAHDSYGYEIIKEIEQRSEGEYELKEPSLYTSLKRLEKQDYIKGYWGDESQGGRRKYYTITPSGENNLSELIVLWQTAQKVINKLLLKGDEINE